MHKTTVYLTDEQVEGLRRLALARNESQAELIREGIGRVLTEAPEREFHSMGKGESKQGASRRWTSDELYEKAFGRSPGD
ncbi:MAG: hypothetical protein QOG26_140 [Solirubrobacterales bacterium]|jgi:Arc/MetJ-type ribon-helix-helix transcriptional regulator|nr:hypothetical protein [Solirubrobacterales bacterium]